MEIGASSACFYPLETEKSFLTVAELGFKFSEIFFNCDSELEKSFIGELKRIKEAYDIKVLSVHPYRSFAEGYDLFSEYKRRYYDALESYKRYFEAMNILGAEYFVLHGSKFGLRIPEEEYAERYGRFNELAKSFGCTVAHENVVNFCGEKASFMEFMKKQLGDEFKMVLDIKQSRRAGEEPEKFIQVMGKNIVHAHLSDFSEKKDCIPPSEKGLFDFAKFFGQMNEAGYEGRYVIELYSDSFKENREVSDSAKYVDGIYKKVRQVNNNR